MPTAKLADRDISYLDEGDGPPIALIHGFASTKEMNWVGPNWVRVLKNAGFRVIAWDNRGHGGSSKFYNEADYTLGYFTLDALAILDYLEVKQSHVMGYSMGARIAATLASNQPDRVSKLVLGGNGYGMVEGSGSWATTVRDGLLAEDPDSIVDLRGMAFRTFADQTKSDRRALAACVMGVQGGMPETLFSEIDKPTLIAIGTKDDVAGSPEKLVKLIPNSSYLPIPNRDHMRAVGDKVFQNGVLDFLSN